MSRSWTHFRRAVLAFAFAGAMCFGATQALASPQQARFLSCPWSPNGPQFDDNCYYDCTTRGFEWGYCDGGQCVCMNFGQARR